MIPEAFYGGTRHIAWSGTELLTWDPTGRLVVCDSSNAAATIQLPHATNEGLEPGPDLISIHNDQASAVVTVQDANGDAVGSLAAGVLGRYSLADTTAEGEWIQTQASTVTKSGTITQTDKERLHIPIEAVTAERFVLRARADRLGYTADRPALVIVDIGGGSTLGPSTGGDTLQSGDWPAGTEFLILIRTGSSVTATGGFHGINMAPDDPTAGYRVCVEYAGTLSATGGGLALKGSPASTVNAGGTLTGSVATV